MYLTRFFDSQLHVCASTRVCVCVHSSVILDMLSCSASTKGLVCVLSGIFKENTQSRYLGGHKTGFWFHLDNSICRAISGEGMSCLRNMGDCVTVWATDWLRPVEGLPVTQIGRKGGSHLPCPSGFIYVVL